MRVYSPGTWTGGVVTKDFVTERSRFLSKSEESFTDDGIRRYPCRTEWKFEDGPEDLTPPSSLVLYVELRLKVS